MIVLMDFLQDSDISTKTRILDVQRWRSYFRTQSILLTCQAIGPSVSVPPGHTFTVCDALDGDPCRKPALMCCLPWLRA